MLGLGLGLVLGLGLGLGLGFGLGSAYHLDDLGAREGGVLHVVLERSTCGLAVVAVEVILGAVEGVRAEALDHLVDARVHVHAPLPVLALLVRVRLRVRLRVRVSKP